MIDIPLGNSAFQIQNFIANDYTPERSARKILLQLDQKQIALADHQFRKKKNDIRRREILKKLEKKQGFEKERLEVELEEINFHDERERKLLLDCLYEIKIYEHLLKQLLPDMNCSRQQFEDSELNYWKTRLTDDARREIMQLGRVEKGTLGNLEKIGITVVKDGQGKLMFNSMEVDNNGNNKLNSSSARATTALQKNSNNN